MSRLPPDIAKHLAAKYAIAEAVPLAGVTVEDLERVIKSDILQKVNIFRILRQKPAKDRARSEWESAKRDAAARLSEEFSATEAEELVTEAAAMLDALPASSHRTAYEYWVYAMHLQSVRKTASAWFDDTPLPWLDTLGNGHLDAGVSQFGDQSLILIRSGTKGFNNLICKALMGTWADLEQRFSELSPESNPDDYVRVIRGLASTSAVISMFQAYLFQGFPHGAEFVLLDDGRANMAARLEEGMDKFIVAHEYAHILRQHHRSSLPKYDQEIEADRIGIVLTIESALKRGSDGVLEMCGAHSIVILQQAVLMLLRKITGNAGIGAEYPPASHRCVNLFGACERRGMLTHQMEVMAQSYWTHLKFLWQIIEPQILEEAKTRKLAPLWSTA